MENLPINKMPEGSSPPTLPESQSSALAKALSQLHAVRTDAEVYSVLLHATRSILKPTAATALGWDNGTPMVLWTTPTPNGSATPMSAPIQWPASLGRESQVRCLTASLVPGHPSDARALVTVPLALPLNGSIQSLLLWIEEEPIGPEHPVIVLLELLKPVAALALANLANHAQNEQDRQALSEAVESVPLGVIAVGADRRILICNRNTEFIFSLRRIAILGNDYTKVLPDILVNAMTDLIQSISHWEETFDREFNFAFDPRTTLRIGISVVPMADTQDKVFGYIFILRDMTLTREAQTLRELNLLNLEFIQTVSHEIKAPLMTVVMGADYLLARGTNFDPEQRETLQAIDQGAQRLQELVIDLLDLVSFESGQVSLDLEFGDLAAVASRVVRFYRKLPNVEISLEMPASLTPFRFDSRKIHRVLENLVSNAIKYSRETKNISIRISRMDDQIMVAVSDCGIGIPAEHLPYIWDKFYRVTSSSTEKVPGTGLGLAITRQIVNMHRGTVHIQSEPGKGSTFSFTLPQGTAL